MEHAQQNLIWRFFEGRLPAEESRPLLAHVAGCNECRGQFEEAQIAYRALGGRADTAGITRAESELIEEAVLGARHEARRRRVLVWTGLALAAAAGMVIVSLPAERADTFTARGVASAPAGLDVLCLPASETLAPVSARAVEGRCPVGSYLKALVTAREGAGRFVSVLAFDQRFTVRMVARGHDLGAAPAALAGHIRIAPGERVLFVALFSRDELAEPALRAAVAKAAAAGAKADETLALEVPADSQEKVLIQAVGENNAPGR